MVTSLRSDRAGFYAFLAFAMVLIAIAIGMLFFTGGGDSDNTTLQTSADISDVPITAPVAAMPVLQAPAAAAVAFAPANFVESTPTPVPPTPTPTPEPTEQDSSATDGASSDSGTSSSSDDGSSGDTSDGAEAGQSDLPPPSAAGGGDRAVSAAAATTLVARANAGGAATIYDSSGNPKQTTYQYLDGSVINYPLTNPTYFGSPLVLRVVSGSADDEMVQVALPTRPNGQTGWIKTADWSFTTSNWYIQINTGNNTVQVWQGEELKFNTQAVTGKSSTPTPRVTAFVDEKIVGPSGAYGPWLLSLGVFSNAHNTFGGGLPKIALHGTNNPELMGQYASNGCIRVTNEAITWIYNNVPVGTYVAIT